MSDSLRTHGLQHASLPEFTQIHVHWVSDAIQPSLPLPPTSPKGPSISRALEWAALLGLGLPCRERVRGPLWVLWPLPSPWVMTKWSLHGVWRSLAFPEQHRMDSSGLGAGPQDAEGLPSWLEPLVISCQGLFPPDLFSSLKGCVSIAWFKRSD